MGRVIWVGYKVAGSLDRGHQGRVWLKPTHNHLAGDPTHYDSASVNIGVKAKLLAQLLAGSQREHPSDPTHYDSASVNIGVKAKLLAQLLAGSQREHPWILYVKAPRTNNSNLN
ncbi:hypothetical protein B0H14DRAFT_2633104 [Mycena olivaceomarginata]|nr:hypothetical protein B0H14DRAFT_2633104 [Mycena olivaceomarginata]